MASKKIRSDALSKLKKKIDRLKIENDKENPHHRTLELKIKDVRECLSVAENAHFEVFNKEEDAAQKQALDEEYDEYLDSIDEILGPAEEKLDLLTAADQPVTLSVTEQGNLAKERAKATAESYQERARVLDADLTGLTNPNRGQLNHHTDRIYEVRREVTDAVKADFQPLYEQAVTTEAAIAIDKDVAALVKPVIDILNSVDKRILELTPDVVTQSTSGAIVSGASSVVGARPNSNPYKNYQKPPVPKFTGAMREYPQWKDEFQKEVLPGLEVPTQIRALHQNTPEEMDLLNCRTVDDAWERLDAKYGNKEVIGALLIDDFVKYTLKGRTPEARLVDLRNVLMSLDTNLSAVECEENLHTNGWIHTTIQKMMPKFWQNKFSEQKQALLISKGSLWLALFSFIKSESKRIETDMPTHLDDHAGKQSSDNKKPENKGSKNVDVSKLPKHLQKQINSVMANPSRNSKNSNSQNAPKSARYDEMVKKIGNCPHCRKLHTFTSQNNLKFVAGALIACEEWKKLDVDKKAEAVQKANACAICLSWGHQRDNCPKGARTCDRPGCSFLHNRLLHGSKIAYCNHVSINYGVISPAPDSEDLPKLMHVVDIKVFGTSHVLTGLLDDASDGTFVVDSVAQDLGFKGFRETVGLMTAGMFEPVMKKLVKYTIPLERIDGSEIVVKAHGMPTITRNATGDVCVDAAYDLFPHIPRNALERPKGNIQLLIGQDYAQLLACGGMGENIVDGLRAMHTVFGTGWVLGGKHPSIKSKPVEFDEETNNMRANLTSIKIINLSQSCFSAFPELQDIPNQPPRKCSRCRCCQSCRYEQQEITRRENEELEMIRDNIWLDKEHKCCKCTYPLIKDPTGLPYNEWQAVAMARSQRKSLIKSGQLEEYEEEINDYLRRGFLSPVTRKEIAAYQAKGGTVCFISHHAVVRLDHATTKVRLVSNSSLSIGGRGNLSPNDHWPKGPNVLKPLVEVLLRFRMNVVALHFDISKMYHSVVTSEQEKYMRLMVWVDENNETIIYGPNKVAFGDKPATAILEKCKDLAAENGRHIDPVAAQAIEDDSYVDDGCTGGTEEEVQRMIGNVTVKDDGSLVYDGTIQQILGECGFTIKMMVRSGDSNTPEALIKMGDGLLGHRWEPKLDEIIFPLSFISCFETDSS